MTKTPMAWSLPIIVVLLAGGVRAASGQDSKQQPANVAGTWVLQVETSGGSGSPTFTFKQDGEKLEGDYKGIFGEAKVTGSVKGSAVAFWFDIDAAGTQATVRYEGTVEKDTMKGTVRIGDLADGTFTGKRQ